MYLDDRDYSAFPNQNCQIEKFTTEILPFQIQKARKPKSLQREIHYVQTSVSLPCYYNLLLCACIYLLLRYQKVIS